MDASTGLHTGHGFDFMDDPVLVVTLDGAIVEANVLARSFFGARLDAGRLQSLLVDPIAQAMDHVRLASNSPFPRPGKITFRGEAGPAQFKIQAARSRRNTGQVEIILRLMPVNADRLVVLDRKVTELDKLLHRRVQENAALQEALRKNRTFVKEMQHRVKNNIQLILSLMHRAARRYTSPEVDSLVMATRGRLTAIAAAQEALYQAAEADIVPTQMLLHDVVLTIARANGAANAVTVSCVDARLSTEEAQCLALIANELITNAARFGLRDGQGSIRVTFAKDEAGHRFEVTDDGVGIRTGEITRHSGLELARNLSRQIGGYLEIDGTQGTTCRVRLPAILG